MRWSEAVTLEFVKIYLKHECLWNLSHPSYKQKYQREKAYSEIGDEFINSTKKSLSIPEVKMKIKNLRTTYVQQVHKILNKSRPDSIYEPSLVWFHEMDSCLKYLPSMRHSSSFNSTQDTSEVDSTSHIQVEQELQNGNISEINPDPLIPQTDEDYDSSKPDEQFSKLNTQKTVNYKKIKKKKLKHRVPIKKYSTDYSNMSDFSNEDEFDIYGKFIASQLRKMDLHKALKLQLDIQNLVSEARISDLKSSD